MADSITNAGNVDVVLGLCDAIHESKDKLSEIDGATGDGDHGVNMNKGFMLAKERIDADGTLSDALETLGDTLVDDIGGSMGPIYGTFFLTLADDLDVDDIDADAFGEALADAADALMDLAGAKPGDKTLVDTIVPARDAFAKAKDEGKGFADCLAAMSEGAEQGWQSTKGMQAKLGRAARLGERSIGHLDAGATSCCIILQTLAKEISAKL
jgi:dihydroxyacetone kinase-like protein